MKQFTITIFSILSLFVFTSFGYCLENGCFEIDFPEEGDYTNCLLSLNIESENSLELISGFYMQPLEGDTKICLKKFAVAGLNYSPAFSFTNSVTGTHWDLAAPPRFGGYLGDGICFAFKSTTLPHRDGMRLTWIDSDGNQGWTRDIYQSLTSFDSPTTSAIGGEILNSKNLNSYDNPYILVAYRSITNEGSYAVEYETIDLDGNPLNNFKVEIYPVYRVNSISVSSADGIGSTIVWDGSDTDFRTSIMGQMIDVDGNPKGEIFTIAPALKKVTQKNPQVYMNQNGAVCLWEDVSDIPGLAHFIVARIYNKSKNSWGDQFILSLANTIDNQNVSVSGDDKGNYIVVWQGKKETGTEEYSSTDIWLQKIDSEGNKIGSTINVNQFQNGNPDRPFIACLNSKNYVVTWTNEINGSKQIVGRYFNEPEVDQITLNICFEVEETKGYKDGDSFKILMDLKSPPTPTKIDFYFIIIKPDGSLMFAPRWGKYSTLLNNFTLPGNLDLQDLQLLKIDLPSEKPLIDMSGEYTFVVVATEPNSFQPVSNVMKLTANYDKTGDPIKDK